MAPRRDKTQWQRLIDEQATSGLTQKAFCKQAGIALGTFGYWRRKLQADALSPPPRSEARTDSASLGDWIELANDIPQEAPGWRIELDLGNGICLRLSRG